MALRRTQSDEILAKFVPGFHQYVWTEQLKLGFVSENLAQMLGIRPRDLEAKSIHAYLEYVFEEDRAAFFAQVTRMFMEAQEALKTGASLEQPTQIAYRLRGTEGKVLLVQETVYCTLRADGTLVANASISDLSESSEPVQDPEELQRINQLVPCGFISYTCDEYPRVTYLNDAMKSILGYVPGDTNLQNVFDLFCSNVLAMVPQEDRERFLQRLQTVQQSDHAIAGELPLTRCDGSRAWVFGWIMLTTKEDGTQEFQSACVDISEAYAQRQKQESSRYIQALAGVYDKIFELDGTAGTLRLVACDDDSQYKAYQGLSLQIGEALERWISASVIDEDRSRLTRFLGEAAESRAQKDGKPFKLQYRGLTSQGEVANYEGVIIVVDEAKALYCCRKLVGALPEATLEDSTQQVKEALGLVSRFTDGITAFEITPDKLVKPLFATENVSDFFGYTPDQWQELIRRPQPLELFVSRSVAHRSEFDKLFKQGEAEFSYIDRWTQKRKWVKAVCSRKSASPTSPVYVMLYQGAGFAGEAEETHPAVTVRTFGYFDVFVGEKPIAFRHKKSKELLALLVDRQGGFVTSEEAIGYLWEDETANPVTLARYRKVALRLKNTLEEYGIPWVVESIDGKRRIVPERISCDLYDYLTGKEEFAHLFKGAYLTNYSWGEMRLAHLTGGDI